MTVTFYSLGWCYTPVTSVYRKLRQEDPKFQAILGSTLTASLKIIFSHEYRLIFLTLSIIYGPSMLVGASMICGY